MPTNPEGGYEDSYQKELRLMREYAFILNEIKDFIIISEKDAGKLSDLFERYNAIDKEIEELKKIDHQLKEELDKMQLEYDNILENSDVKLKLEEKIDAQHDKIIETWNRQYSLRKEQMREEASLRGDHEGTESVIKLKFQKLDEIKKQLDELEN